MKNNIFIKIGLIISFCFTIPCVYANKPCMGYVDNPCCAFGGDNAPSSMWTFVSNNDTNEVNYFYNVSYHNVDQSITGINETGPVQISGTCDSNTGKFQMNWSGSNISGTLTGVITMPSYVPVIDLIGGEITIHDKQQPFLLGQYTGAYN